MICCVRSAIRAASAVGSARASSWASVCSDWVPPSTAVSAWIATRAMLFIAGFADVIAADGNGVEAGSKARAEFKSIDHQAHGRRRRIDVFLLRDVFLEDVVLNGAGNFLPIGALLFRHRQVHGPQHRGRRIDG